MSQIVVTPDGKRHIFPDGATPAQMKAALASYAPQAAPAPRASTAPPGSPVPWGAMPLRPGYGGLTAADVISQLPNIGGALGGLGGAALGAPSGPGAFAAGLGGAAAGGAAGEAAKQALFGQPVEAGPIARQGGLQAAYEALGGMLAKSASVAAKPLMERALRVPYSIARDFPATVERALSEAVPATRQGMATASTLRGQSAGKLNDILVAATNSGKTFATADVTAPVQRILANKAVPTATKEAIARDLQAFIAQHGPSIDPVLLKQIKQVYQDMARTAYSAGAERGGAAMAGAAHPQFAKAIAKGAQQELEKIPGVAAQESNTQALIGLAKATRRRALSPPRDLRLDVPATWPVLNNPAVTSQLAIALANKGAQRALAQTPRLTLAQLFYGAPQDATARP